MIPVDPYKQTTLILDRFHCSTNRFYTAREAIKKLVTGRILGIDAMGNAVSWTGAAQNINSPPSTFCWQDNSVALFEDQPCLRSAPNSLSGLETQWAVPTIALCLGHFGHSVKKGKKLPLKQLHKLYKGICQYCGDRISLSQSSEDHVIAKYHHGADEDFNLVLSCKPCNSKKGHTVPYFDKDGKLPIIRKQGFTLHLSDSEKIRPEWKIYLFKD